MAGDIPTPVAVLVLIGIILVIAVVETAVKRYKNPKGQSEKDASPLKDVEESRSAGIMPVSLTKANAVWGSGLLRAKPARKAANVGPIVFLCHSSGDKEEVRSLYQRLVGDGVNCWFDEVCLMPGQDWEYEIAKAVRASQFVLACLSQNSISRAGYVQKELKKALDVADEQPEGVAYLIPVRLEECVIPDRLSRWHWVDLFKGDGYERLLRVPRA